MLVALHAGGGRNHAVEIATGGGKTKFALLVAWTLLHDRQRFPDYRRVMILVPPRKQLFKQWNEERDAFAGGELRCTVSVAKFNQKAIPPAGSDTLVVIDEFHHLRDDKAWGRTVRVLAGAARGRVLMSGTPFRDDGQAPSFSSLDLDGAVSCVYRYLYEQAMVDGVCRKLNAFDQDGEIRWKDGGLEYVHRLPERLPPRHDSQRFRTAIQVDGVDFHLAPLMLRKAVQKLRDLKERSPKAQGLILTANKLHADAVRQFMVSECHCRPSIVTGDTDNAQKEIQNFKKNALHMDWLISINMISEGTDIPNLVVMVYLTSVRTKMYMMQSVGRVLRRQADVDEGTAFVYFPGDQRVCAVFKEMAAASCGCCEADGSAEPSECTLEAAEDSPTFAEPDDAAGACAHASDRAKRRRTEDRLCFDDDASTDGEIDPAEEVWSPIAAGCVDDEDEDFRRLVEKSQRVRTGVSYEEIRRDVRRVLGMPELGGVNLEMSEEHQQSAMLRRVCEEVKKYVFRYKKKIPKEDLGEAIAYEYRKLVLRLLKRRDRLPSDRSARISELCVEDLKDILALSIPSRRTKLARLV